MSRSKKSRKPGALMAEAISPTVTRNRTQSDVDGREQKRQKKRKGLKAGNRHSDGSDVKAHGSQQARDPRLGSKKKIPLIIEPKKKQTKQERKISAAQELEMLENDAQLNVLLDRIEMGENLGAGLQKVVDEKLDRIEVLMKQLGILDEEAVEEETQGDEFVVPVTHSKPSNKAVSDDDLLDQFESFNIDDFKG